MASSSRPKRTPSSSANMIFKTRYVYDDFKASGSEHCKTGYSALRDLLSYEIKKKTYANINSAPQRATMILVGTYYYRTSNQGVWACSDGSEVHYYFGNGDIVDAVKDMGKYRIYFKGPFEKVSGNQDSRGSNAGRKLGHAVVGVMIHYLFLLMKHITHVLNNNGKDILACFKYACEMLKPNCEADAETKLIKTERDSVGNEEEMMVQNYCTSHLAETAFSSHCKGENEADNEADVEHERTRKRATRPPPRK